MLQEGKGKQKRRKWWKSYNNRAKERNKRWKKTRVTTKMKKEW
jgi:hypothetical protein